MASPLVPVLDDLLPRIDRIEPAAARGPLRRLLAREVSPPVALIELLVATGGQEAVERQVLALAGPAGPESPLAELAALLADRERCARAAALLAAHPAPCREDEWPDEPAAAEAAIRACREFFDLAVRQSEEASVALYSLGDPDALARATAEVIEMLAARHLFSPARTALEIGCGIGRFLAPLAGRLGSVVGTDISPGMLAAARRRSQGLPNVRLARTSGQDLAAFRDGSFDLVLAVDSMPYVFQAGPAALLSHFEDTARILRPGGDLVVLNFSYQGTPAADRENFAMLCGLMDLEVLAAGTRPLRLWDGALFHARKPPDPAALPPLPLR